jgi:protein-S-isoprenylcysteine O-methyltransferase Ste14
MKRYLIFGYGVLSYAFFFATFLYAIGFIGNVVVPKSIDSASVLPVSTALMINLGLLMLFAVQHSGMARPAFKRWLTKFIPEETERSTYVLLSTVCLALLMWQWAPLGGVVWSITSQWGVMTLTGLYFASWALLLYATFLIDHFDLFGLRQVTHALRSKAVPPLEFQTPVLYKIVRHPIYVGWLGIFWFTPEMTVTHLVFAVITTAYTVVGMKLEEADLEKLHPEYSQYKRNVPALIPFLGRRVARRAAIQSS